MSKFTDHLWSDLVREHGATLAQADRPGPARARVLRRPRILAGSSLGLAGIGAALVLILGGSAAPAAFAITTNGDGTVQVQLNYTANKNLPQVNQKLASMGTGEAITIWMAPGSATSPGPVSCARGTGVAGPKVTVLVGSNGTEVIGTGQSGDNTAEGSFHLVRCLTSSNTGSGNTGTG
jgi:hypothetical protein